MNRIYCHETFDIGRDEGMVVNREYEDRGRFEFMKGYLHGMVFKYRTKSILKSQKWIYATTGIRIKHYEEIDMTITVMNLATTKETPRPWKGLNCAAQAVIIIACAVLLALSAGSAVAAEGGSSFYLLGQRGQGAAVLPPVEGVFFALPTYYYSGDASVSKNIPIGGAVSLGLDVDLFLALPTAIWVTPADVFGGDLAFSGTFVYGKADLSANAAVSIPGIIQGSVDLSDDRWAVGDPAFSALVGWHGENHHYLVAASVNVPVGDYDAGRLSNVALNRWAVDISVAGTWMFPQNNIELSGTTGITFNGKNDDTEYETGTEFHLEASAFYQFTPKFSAGVNGYHYQQVSDDSGAGAALGDFKGRVTALGPGLSGTFQVGPAPVSVSLRYLHEFNVKNRLEGEAVWLTVSIPLWVPGQNP